MIGKAMGCSCWISPIGEGQQTFAYCFRDQAAREVICSIALLSAIDEIHDLFGSVIDKRIGWLPTHGLALIL